MRPGVPVIVDTLGWSQGTTAALVLKLVYTNKTSSGDENLNIPYLLHLPPAILSAYDGGDCCYCTCEPGEDPDVYSCSEFACIDPEATCVDDDAVTTDMVENCQYATGIGNGYCDEGNNNAECGANNVFVALSLTAVSVQLL